MSPASGAGEHVARLPVLSLETHRASDKLLAQIRAVESGRGHARLLIAASPGDDTPDSDGVVLADGSGGRWAVKRAGALQNAGFPGLIVVVSPKLEREVVLDGYSAGVHLWEQLPLDAQLFAARARSLVRRLVGDDQGLELSVRVHRVARVVAIDGRRVKLGQRGFTLFEYLLERRGRWVSQEELMARAFGAKHARGTSVVRVHVMRVRALLGEDLAWVLEGKEGFGYRLTLRRDSTAGRLHLPHARFRGRRP